MIVHHRSNRLSEMERDLEGERRKSISLQESLKESEKEYHKLKVSISSVSHLLSPTMYLGAVR